MTRFLASSRPRSLPSAALSFRPSRPLPAHAPGRDPPRLPLRSGCPERLRADGNIASKRTSTVASASKKVVVVGGGIGGLVAGGSLAAAGHQVGNRLEFSPPRRSTVFDLAL